MHRYPRRQLALLLSMALLGTLLAAAPANSSPTKTPVMGPATLSEQQVLDWFNSRWRPEFRATVDEATLIRYFREEGEKEGVDWNVAFAQAILETGWFNFPDHGQVRPEDNNFGGMGAFDGGDGSNVFRFPDARTGVRAKLQHLRIYGDPTVDTEGTNLGSPIAVDVDERYPDRWRTIRNGSGPHGPYHASATIWQEMGNGLWATDQFYACKVLNLYRQMLNYHGRSTTGLPTASFCCESDPTLVNPFWQDVGFSHPFCAEIARLAADNVIAGFDDRTFRPTAAVTRQAAAAFLHRQAGAPSDPFPDPDFPDVTTSHPFYTEIAWMVDTGIAAGFDDGTYQPTREVTRQATARFLDRR